MYFKIHSSLNVMLGIRVKKLNGIYGSMIERLIRTTSDHFYKGKIDCMLFKILIYAFISSVKLL